MTLGKPLGLLSANGTKHILIQSCYHAILLKQRNKSAGRNQTSVLFPPTYQRLTSHNLSGSDAILRLIPNFKITCRQRFVKSFLQLLVLLQFLMIHLMIEDIMLFSLGSRLFSGDLGLTVCVLQVFCPLHLINAITGMNPSHLQGFGPMVDSFRKPFQTLNEHFLFFYIQKQNKNIFPHMTSGLVRLEFLRQNLPNITNHPVAGCFARSNVDVIEVHNIHGNHIPLQVTFFSHVHAELRIIGTFGQWIFIGITPHQFLTFSGQHQKNHHPQQNKYGHCQCHQIQFLLHRRRPALQNICRYNRQHIPGDIAFHQLHRRTIVIMFLIQIKRAAIG